MSMIKFTIVTDKNNIIIGAIESYAEHSDEKASPIDELKTLIEANF